MLIKQRCVSLLGSLGGAINHSLVSSKASGITKKAVAWDHKQHLRFDVPFMDIKPTIYFGKYHCGILWQTLLYFKPDVFMELEFDLGIKCE